MRETRPSGSGGGVVQPCPYLIQSAWRERGGMVSASYRGANVPPDKIDTLVQYLAKNFGPKDASAPPAPAPSN